MRKPACSTRRSAVILCLLPGRLLNTGQQHFMCLSLQLPAEVLSGADEAALLPTQRACTAAGCTGYAAAAAPHARPLSVLDQGSQLRAREGGQELSPSARCAGQKKATDAAVYRSLSTRRVLVGGWQVNSVLHTLQILRDMTTTRCGTW